MSGIGVLPPVSKKTLIVSAATISIIMLTSVGTTWLVSSQKTADAEPVQIQTDPDPDLPVTLLAPLTPVRDFPLLATSRSGDEIRPQELVLGITIGDETRAYPINMMNQDPSRKVINDTLGGHAIAATWCDACHNAIVYERQVEGRIMTLAVSGKLWHESMLMYDLETKSLWSHLLGEAKWGPLAGKRLTVLPSVVMDWSTWKRKYPNSTVLGFRHGTLVFNRNAFDQAGFFVLGIASGHQSKMWELSELKREHCRNDFWLGKPVLAIFEPDAAAARLYCRTIKGKELHFALEEGTLKDNSTGSTWDIATGKAIAGALVGESLAPMPAIISFREAWLRFHPSSS